MSKQLTKKTICKFLSNIWELNNKFKVKQGEPTFYILNKWRFKVVNI